MSLTRYYVARVLADSMKRVREGKQRPDAWHTLSTTDQARMRGTAAIFVRWAERVPVERMTVQRVAHAIHAAYSVYSMRHWQLERSQCRTWTGESPEQKRCFLDAARHILATLRRQAKAERRVPA